MAVREIIKVGDKRLERVSKKVVKFDEEIAEIIKDMKDTLYSTKGVGLAAPQIGVLKKIILVDLRDGSGPIVMVNPKIITKVGRVEDFEGCLSYPGYEGVVVRPRRVIVKGLNEKGEEFDLTVENFLGRVFCHEIDHLDGVMYMKRAKKMFRLEE